MASGGENRETSISDIEDKELKADEYVEINENLETEENIVPPQNIINADDVEENIVKEKRARTLTEKGVAYQIEQLKMKLTALLLKLKNKSKILEESTKNREVEVNELLRYTEDFRTCTSTFIAVQQEYISLLLPEEAHKENNWARAILEAIQKLDEKVERLCLSVRLCTSRKGQGGRETPTARATPSAR